MDKPMLVVTVQNLAVSRRHKGRIVRNQRTPLEYKGQPCWSISGPGFLEQPTRI